MMGNAEMIEELEKSVPCRLDATHKMKVRSLKKGTFEMWCPSCDEQGLSHTLKGTIKPTGDGIDGREEN
jgi:hypothetical protein